MSAAPNTPCAGCSPEGRWACDTHGCYRVAVANRQRQPRYTDYDPGDLLAEAMAPHRTAPNPTTADA